jgi:dTDP-glucose 4,6-dehydratase
VTGAAGFIGSAFVRYLLEKAPSFTGRVVCLDALTYAGNPANLAGLEEQYGGRFVFERGDICDGALAEKLFKDYGVDAAAHFAAETHVDRSILGPEAFVRTNVLGTFTLLEAARKAWAGKEEGRFFHHVSTDEVYGSLGASGAFSEESPYAPRSPYSASKAASDHLVTAYRHTYGLPAAVSSCSNNYGPRQFPEKLIPLMILNMLEGKELPVYGDGKNVRDWLYVEDHCAAVWTVMTRGRAGEKYNIGGENEWENVKLLEALIGIVAGKAGLDEGKLRERIVHVKDRPGHDRRYAIDCGKIKRELGWERAYGFEEGLSRTVDWYLSNPRWIEGVRSGAYRNWMERNYGGRGKG